MRQAVKDVGHLPPHIREAMLNSVSEKYLPKYEDLVKKYYEDLAEKSRKHNEVIDFGYPTAVPSNRHEIPP